MATRLVGHILVIFFAVSNVLVPADGRYAYIRGMKHTFTVGAIPQTSINRLTASRSATAPPAILSSRDRSIAGYS